MNNSNDFIFTAENVSKYWNLLNNSNNPNDKIIANKYLIELKKNCQQCLEISIQLYRSQSLDDKLISCLLLYQYIKENPKNLLSNEQLFNQIKNYILDNILIPYTNKKEEKEETTNTNKSKESLIIERVCYSMSIIVLIGCCSYWPNAIDDMLSFGKSTLKHTYLITIIFGNCNNELKDLFLSNKHEFIIKNKFIEKKEEFKYFINTILINANKIDKKLYNKTVDLAINLTNFEVNVLYIPNLINVVLSDINTSNIDSLTKLFTESINCSKSKKLEDEYNDIDITEFDSKITKDELTSFSYIIDIIITYVQNHSNNLNEDIIFGLGQIFSSFTENFVYMFFKKDSMSQKIFNLFFFFICHKIRKVSELLFETIPTIKNFINGNYKFSNYSDDEKIQFMNFFLKILFNITNNCTYKSIIKKQDIQLAEEYITIQNKNNKSDINTNNINNIDEEDLIDEIDEISIEDYRVAAEDVFINVFEIFALNYGKEGINYFFTQITKDIIPILEKNINEINERNLLSVEILIYIIQTISSSFEELNLDKTTLNQFVLILIRSQIALNDFILVNFLLLLDEASTIFNYNNSFFNEIIIFLLNQLSLKMNNEQDSNEISRLISFVLNHICEACENIFVPEAWEKIYQVYIHYYDNFCFHTLDNITDALCNLLIFETNESDEKENILTNDMIINYFKKIAEAPAIRIKKIGEIITNKNKEYLGNKDKEKKVRLEIMKNFNVISLILKQSSFINDKSFINCIFNEIYQKTFQQLYIIINEYHKDNDIMNCFMITFTKCSAYLNIESLNSIYQNFNELVINSFLINNDNYHCIYVLKNIYSLKLKNIKDKNSSNKEYVEIYTNFLKLLRQICSAIITTSNYKMELMIALSLFFFEIFSKLNQINKEDYIIILDTITILNQGIKYLCDNRIINNILYAFIIFIESPNYELINDKYIEIIKSVFSSFDHFNSNISKSFADFCECCLKINKRDFMNTFKEILNGSDFNRLNNNNKILLYNYIDHFWNKNEKIKKIFEKLLFIIQKNISDSVDDIFEKFNKELTDDISNINKKTVTFF